MKKLLIYIGAVTTMVAASCTKDFDKINTNPTQASSDNFDPNLLLPTAEVNYAGTIQGYSGAILFQSMWAQIFANAEYPTYYSNGDKYVASGNILTYAASIWNNAYQAASKAKEIQSLIAEKGMDAPNLSGVSYIVQLLNLELVTDVYGDVPYSQALQAKTGNIAFPVYDKQSDIYPSMLNSLDSVIGTLNTSGGDKVTNDIIYKGDITKWKKFGYSLMLRMAMRLTKVDAATAQKYAVMAAAGGAFSSVADNAFVTFDNANGYNNANASALQVPEDFSQVRWSKPLMDFLKATADPRVMVVAEVPKNGTANNLNKSLDGDHTFAKQIGMPSGYDQNGGATDISKEPNYPGVSPADPSITGDAAFAVGLYSRPTAALYTRNLSTPGFILTYAETELLFAEAAARGWSVGASAAQHYHNGLSAALQSLGTLNSAGTISSADAEAYATAHPLNTSSETASLTQINWQFWATTGTMFNFIEAWNNWRRSGYPNLTPVNYNGNFTNGQIPRRETYPSTEPSNNGENYNAGKAGMGGDDWTTRMWWDKQ